MWTPGTEERRDASSLWEEVRPRSQSLERHCCVSCLDCEVRSYDRQSFLVACSMRARHGQDTKQTLAVIKSCPQSSTDALDLVLRPKRAQRSEAANLSLAGVWRSEFGRPDNALALCC